MSACRHATRLLLACHAGPTSCAWSSPGRASSPVRAVARSGRPCSASTRRRCSAGARRASSRLLHTDFAMHWAERGALTAEPARVHVFEVRRHDHWSVLDWATERRPAKPRHRDAVNVPLAPYGVALDADVNMNHGATILDIHGCSR